jgi:hypothetical protein
MRKKKGDQSQLPKAEPMVKIIYAAGKRGLLRKQMRQIHLSFGSRL